MTMEIRLSAGDKIQIPTGCKATIEDNQIIIEEQKEEQKEEFKDGDILHSKTSYNAVIFKEYDDDNTSFSSYYNNGNATNSGWNISCFMYATEEEKQEFFDELKAKGLRWNTETKTMEKIRKREEYGESYLYVNRLGEVCAIHELKSCFDDDNFNSGNYYSAEESEQAEADAKAIKAIFEKRKIENI